MSLTIAQFDLNQLETQNLYEAISNIFLSGEDVAPHFHRLHGDDEDYDDLNPVIQELSVRKSVSRRV